MKKILFGVMETQRKHKDVNHAIAYGINQAMFIGDAAAPKAMQLSLQRLWFPNSRKGMLKDVSKQLCDAPHDALITYTFPICQVFFGLGHQLYFHRSSIFTTLPRPFLISSWPWRRISTMVGEDMRYSVSSIACFLAESFLRYFTAFCIKPSSSAMMLSSRNNSALSCSAVIIPFFAILPAKVSTKALTAKGITLKKIERLCDEPFSMT